MSITIEQLGKQFDQGVDRVRQMTRHFCEPLGITTFGYVRVSRDGDVSWLTTQPDQDRFLIESGALDDDPLLNTPEALKEGMYLWFNDRQFPGCETFYRERSRLFKMDHGMVVVRHHKNYLETCCFSGLLAQRPLYNFFLNEKALFNTFMEHFTVQIDLSLLNLLEKGVTIGALKSSCGQPSVKDVQLTSEERATLAEVCGWKNLLKLSKREKECLMLLPDGYTYQMIGTALKLSERTVEHYLDSVKNKLGLKTRAELHLAAKKLKALGLFAP